MDFNKTVDELYQLCRRVQEEVRVSVRFEIVNYKAGQMLTICIYGKKAGRISVTEMYNICENGYQEEENAQKAKEHLNQLLLNKPCPYCEVNENGE